MMPSTPASGPVRTESVLRLSGPEGHISPSPNQVKTLETLLANIENRNTPVTYEQHQGMMIGVVTVPGLRSLVLPTGGVIFDLDQPGNPSLVALQTHSPQQDTSHSSPCSSGTAASAAPDVQTTLSQPDLSVHWMEHPLRECLHEDQRQQVINFVKEERLQQGQPVFEDFEAMFNYTYRDIVESMANATETSQISDQIRRAALKAFYS